MVATPATRAERAPIERDEDGVLRVGGTRVTFDTVALAYLDGATPEEIVQRYPSLQLADVYATIGYYLHHRPELDEYLAARANEESEARREIEARPDTQEIRKRLLARRNARGA